MLLEDQNRVLHFAKDKMLFLIVSRIFKGHNGEDSFFSLYYLEFYLPTETLLVFTGKRKQNYNILSAVHSFLYAIHTDTDTSLQNSLTSF